MSLGTAGLRALLTLAAFVAACSDEGGVSLGSSEPRAEGTDAAQSAAPDAPDPSSECAACSFEDGGLPTSTAMDTDAGVEAGQGVGVDASVVADTGPAAPLATCPPDVDVRDVPSCVRDEEGLFVDSSGSDANPGTKAAPLKTLGAAVAKLAGRTHVFVCRGLYAESVTLPSGTSVHGGFECKTWRYSAGLVSIMPEAGQYALHLDGVHGAVLSDLSLIAAAGSARARSSVAAFVSRSTQVVLRRVLLQAQAGADGEWGARGSAGKTDVPPDGLSSNSNTEGGPAHICTCSNGGITIGGAGGGGAGAGDTRGGNGTPRTAIASPPEAFGAGQTGMECTQGISLHMRGSAGAPGRQALPVTVVGYVDAEHGFVPADGEAGGPGDPGQGGGGGGGHDGNDPGGGGSGGCGGCGASGSLGGQGGGASVGLLAVEAELRIEASVIVTDRAGKGGGGLEGERGGQGAGGGAGFGAGCTGGRGGDGGAGGASGGGAGGVSIGVAYRGAPPVLDEATRMSITVRAAGTPGRGGAPGFNDGPPGISAPIQAL